MPFLCRGDKSGKLGRSEKAGLTKPFILRPSSKLTHYRPLTKEQKQNNVPSMFTHQEAGMLKVFVEEAAALASIVLFVGMIAIWAQLLPQL